MAQDPKLGPKLGPKFMLYYATGMERQSEFFNGSDSLMRAVARLVETNGTMRAQQVHREEDTLRNPDALVGSYTPYYKDIQVFAVRPIDLDSYMASLEARRFREHLGELREMDRFCEAARTNSMMKHYRAIRAHLRDKGLLEEADKDSDE